MDDTDLADVANFSQHHPQHFLKKPQRICLQGEVCFTARATLVAAKHTRSIGNVERPDVHLNWSTSDVMEGL